MPVLCFALGTTKPEQNRPKTGTGKEHPKQEIPLNLYL